MKNRNKNISSEKSPSAAAPPDDAPKKSPKSAAGNASSGGGGGPGPLQGSSSGSGSCLGLVATAVFYVALLGAAGFAALHVQRVVEELRETGAGHAESARRSVELSGQMESVVQQVWRRLNACHCLCHRHYIRVQVGMDVLLLGGRGRGVGSVNYSDGFGELLFLIINLLSFRKQKVKNKCKFQTPVQINDLLFHCFLFYFLSDHQSVWRS